ncbi:MAG: glycerophosphodiester phosphodiesterase [Actinomyces sp.]|nr:glycerophosphodiester phosphodiesterase [Actinomyces sp.]
MMPVTMRQGPIIFAHRGGSEEAPENTMSAFAHTYEAGIRHVETDAHITADGKVVLCHDETVDRCYDGTGAIAQMTWRELSKLRHRDSGEQIPLLAQVLEAFPDMYFNIDAKEPGVEGPLLDVIADHGAANRVLVASFSEPRLRAVRDTAASDPARAVATSLGTEAVVRLVGAAKSATNPAWWHVPGPRQGAIAAQVPMHQGPIRVVDERFVATAHTLGLAVHVWTINTVADVLRLLEVGAGGCAPANPPEQTC